MRSAISRSYLSPLSHLAPNFIQSSSKTTKIQRDMPNHYTIISLCRSCLNSYLVILSLAWGRQTSFHFNLGTACGMKDASWVTSGPITKRTNKLYLASEECHTKEQDLSQAMLFLSLCNVVFIAHYSFHL